MFSETAPLEKSLSLLNPKLAVVSNDQTGSEAIKAQQPLRFITCGSVDDGKSTLIGRLLWDTKALTTDQVASVKGTKDELQHLDLAHLLDGLQAEREQGITIDVAYRYFSTSKRSFIVADTPGHEQYTRNMATGASTADLAILLVDARVGLLEQTRRHALIASIMGIKQVVLAVNKIDLVDYDQQRFDAIADAFKVFSIALGFDKLDVIPLSALHGYNVAREAPEQLAWYDGPTLLAVLEQAACHTPQIDPVRFPVQRVSRPDETFRGYEGTSRGGRMSVGDTITVLPSRKKAKISRIATFDGDQPDARAGDAVSLVLDRPLDISRGDMLVGDLDLPMVSQHFDAKVIVLDDNGLEEGKSYWLKAGARTQRATIGLLKILNLQSADWEDRGELNVNSIAKISITLDQEAVFDPFAVNKQTGSFILIDPDSNNTVAGGMIDKSGNGDGPSKVKEPAVMLSLPKSLALEILQLKSITGRLADIEVFETSIGNAQHFVRDHDPS